MEVLNLGGSESVNKGASPGGNLCGSGSSDEVILEELGSSGGNELGRSGESDSEMDSGTQVVWGGE